MATTEFSDSAIQLMSDVTRLWENKLHAQMEDQPTADQFLRGLRVDFTRQFTPDEQMMFIRDMIDEIEHLNNDDVNQFLRGLYLQRVETWAKTLSPEMRVYFDHLRTKNIDLVE